MNRRFRSAWGLHRLALHASGLSFEHPVTGAPLELSAPLPEDLAEPLQRLGMLVGKGFAGPDHEA